MSTQFTNRQWRLPNNENKDKQSNYSMDFDGNVQHIKASNFSGLADKSSGSFSLWFKTTNTTSNAGKCILSIPYSGGGNGFDIYINNSTSLKSYLKTSTFTTTTTNTITYGDSNWHHVAVVYDGSTHKIYFDTVDVTNTSTPSPSGAIAASTVNTIEIGRFSTSYQNEFNGQIDGVSIFDYALSSSQVTTLYGSSSTGIGNPMSLSPKPVATYNLGDQDAFNGASYLTPNASLKDFVFSFDSSNNNYINIASAGGIALMNTGVSSTVSLWVYPTGTGTRVFFEQSTPGRYIIYQSGTSLFFYPNGARASFTNLILNQWYNVIAIVDGSNSKFYVNGNEVGTSTSYTPVNTLGVLEFGRYPGGTQYFDGKMSNVQIFNSALPATGSNSVETLYNNGSPLTSMSGFTSLQGWWKLNASATYDGTDWTIPDDSSNSNDGTSSGMTQANLVQSDLSFTSGYSPYALNFDSASSDYIDCGNISALNNLSEITISFWYKFQGTDTQNGIISQNPIFEIQDVYNAMYFHIDGTSKTINVPTGTFNYKDGNWHNFVCTYKAGDAQIMYIDNTQYASSSTTNTNLPTTTANLNIGRRNNGFRYADMSFSNASIWNTALTSAQVTEIYNEGAPSNLNNHSAYSNLVSWWQLGSNSSFNSTLNQWTCIDEKGTNTGESSQTFNEDAIVDGVGSYANGLSSGMGGDEVIGDAPYSTANSLSVNMDVLDRVTDTPS